MVLFSYLLYYLLLAPVSRLPFRVLYWISDLLYVVLYRIAGYRLGVVRENLKNSFPERSRSDLRDLEKKFYRHLCDLVVESIKLFSISDEEVRRRMTCRNPEVMNRLFDRNKSVVLAGGHINNWELFAVAIDQLIQHRTVGIYKPLSDKFLNDKMQRSRSKYGLIMIATNEVKQTFEAFRSSPSAFIFAIDQSPSSASRCYWTTFLNQDTAVLFGTEKYAREYDYPVVFGRLLKVKRGFYELEFELAVADPAASPYGEITEKVTRLLEQDILHAPQYWLWSHKRWKRKRTPDPGPAS